MSLTSQIFDKLSTIAPFFTYFTFLYFLYAFYVYTVWDKHFGGKRVGRGAETCPSNRKPPDIKTYEQNRKNILDAAELHPDNYASCELLNPLMKNKSSAQKRDGVEKAWKRNVERSGHLKWSKSNLLDENYGKLSEKKADNLNMDHVYLTFPQLLWAYTFVGPNAYYLWLKGLLGLWIRIKLNEMGLLKAIPHDPNEVVGRLCLEGTLAVHYYARTDKDSNLGDIAGFFFRDFPYIDNNCIAKRADLFAVDIDLKTKKMVKAKLDDENISAEEALILLWFNTITGNHVKLHALANWGINNESDIKKKNFFLYQNSIVTVVYNFFGFTCFAKYIPTWINWGFLSPNWNTHSLVQVFEHGVKDNIWSHPNITELIPFSNLVSFICKCRAMFLAEFAKYQDDFPGIHGEALFVGTVLHSLDHTCMDRNLEDPLWLNVNCSKFGRMAELGRIVKVGFVKDVPGLMFHKRFKGSKHPFYQSVYCKAAKMNSFYAENMDTCIIK